MTAANLRLELFVHDVARSVTFYRDVLGFEVLDTPAQATYRPMRLGSVRIALQDVGTLEAGHPLVQPGKRGLGVELVLEVPDVQASHVQAQRHAQSHSNHRTGMTPLVQQPWGLTDFRVTDPDGYYWRVTGRRRQD